MVVRALGVTDGVAPCSWSVGRSVKVKKKLREELMGSLASAGFNPENVMVCFKETSWENWAFGGGRLIHA